MKHFEGKPAAEKRPALAVVDSDDGDTTEELASEETERELRSEHLAEPDLPEEPPIPPALPEPRVEPEIQLSRPPAEVISETNERRLTAESRLEMLDGIGDGLERIRAELEAQELVTPPLVRELEATRDRVEARKQALASEIAELERTRVAVERTSVELEQLRADLAVKLSDLSELKATAAIWTSRVDDLESEVDALVERIDTVARELAHLVESGAHAPGVQAATEVHSPAGRETEIELDAAPAAVRSADQAHLLFVPQNDGYDLVERDGPAPAVGDSILVGDAAWVVTKVGPSPLPYDDRTCVFFTAD
jgi:hypothetical protein